MNREQIMEALNSKFNSLIDTASDPTPDGKVVVVSRRLRTWDQAPKPSLYIFERFEDYSYQSSTFPKQKIRPALFYYFDAGKDPNVVPSTTLNTMMDTIDVCLAPDNGDGDRCTLGGLVSHCYITGEVIKVPGDLDGEGMAVIPLEILVP